MKTKTTLHTKRYLMDISVALIALLVASLLAGTVAFAQTYLYVNEQGQLEVEVAETPTEAIQNADNIMHDSGVILAKKYYNLADGSSNFGTGGPGDEIYAYVALDGDLAFISTNSPEEAMASATDIAVDSGVMLATNY